MERDRFLLSAGSNFYHDCKGITFTHDLLGQLFDRLYWMGVKRIYWYYYPKRFWNVLADGAFPEGWGTIRETLDNLGDPMLAAYPLARERGMEFFATIKPYETGFTHTNPPGSPAAKRMPGPPGIGGMYEVDPWVLARPELRLRCRSGDLPVGLETVPIERVQLRQKDMSPIRIGAEELEIWTSPDNSSYRKRDVGFTLSESVESCPEEVYNSTGELVTRKGDSVRALNISGFSLLDPFVALSTSFDDDRGTFRNTALEMVRAFGPDDRPMDTVVGSYRGLLSSPGNYLALIPTHPDLRTTDLYYDTGFGDVELCLDASNRGGGSVDGVIAIARGRNEYLPGALCEAYPEVQSYWLSWADECIAAGVDGMEVLLSSHSTWTDHPDVYGFNEPVAEEYRRRHVANPDVEPYDPGLLGALRGEFFDQFLQGLRRRLSAAGKRMQLHLDIESFRPGTTLAKRRSLPGNMTINWRSWLRSGLADEATLGASSLVVDRALSDPVGREMLQEIATAGVRAHFQQWVMRDRDPQVHADCLEAAYRDEAIAGFTLFETGTLLEDPQHFRPGGPLLFLPGVTEALRDRASGLGIV